MLTLQGAKHNDGQVSVHRSVRVAISGSAGRLLQQAYRMATTTRLHNTA